MARRNRLVVSDGVYHITSRIANQAFFLSNPRFKDDIVTWIYGIADFSGIDVLSWCIMDNHFHLLVNVPPVPEQYWTESSDEPQSAAFSMRPRESRAPRWTPDITDPRPFITPADEYPTDAAIRRSISDGVPLVILPRPATGFMLSDKEMIERLKRLEDGHSPKAVLAIQKRWTHLRKNECDKEVDIEKEAFCRRMYNISQFMKTLKQRISQQYNLRFEHTGHLWSDRFYSGLVEREEKALACVAAYIDLNPVRAKIASHPTEWTWSSFACASGSSRFAKKAQKGYESIFGCEWKDARTHMESIFTDKLPEGYNPDEDRFISPSTTDDKRIHLRMTQHIHRRIPEFTKASFISSNTLFPKRVLKTLPLFFPAPSPKLAKFFEQTDWSYSPSRETRVA